LQDRTTVDEGKAVLLPAPGAATVPAHPTWRDYLVLFALACGPAAIPSRRRSRWSPKSRSTSGPPEA